MLRMIASTFLALVVISTSFQSSANAQFLPEPSAEHKLLHRDVGDWDATVKVWMGPDGKADPSVEPQVSKGTETNRMLGMFWLLSTFKGDFGGMPFEGHAVNGYDSKKKKFVGSWTDSMTPFAMHMIGTYDKKSDSMTNVTKGIGMEGEEVTGKIVVKYEGKDKRLMTMYESQDGKDVKSMEILYVRSK